VLLGQKSELKLPSYDSLDDMLERFSQYFNSKIKNIRANLDKKDATKPEGYYSVLPLPVIPPTALLQSFQPMTNEAIIKLIRSSPTKSCSLDPLPTWLLKDVADELAPSITRFVNLSITTSNFPSEMKKALVTPLLKKPTLDTEILKNYRPVSNLSFLSKLTERVVAKQLSSHMVQNNLHAPVQSAYRPLHSTETALLRVLNDMLISVDEGKGVILVLLDLSAAFDTIDHDILIDRLSERLGVREDALGWFKSYLSKRLQSVYLNGSSSKPTFILFGVPQGSVLGPVKFTAYQTPLFDIARLHGVDIHLYADDTQLYVSFDLDSRDDCDMAVSKIEHCIEDVRVWMTQNKLKLNDDKSELLFISSSWQKRKSPVTDLTIGNHTVSPTSSAKNLGVTFDSHLKMDAQVRSICQKSHFHLRNIGKIRKYLNLDSANKVVHAFISSRLDYNNSLLYGLPKTQILKLQRLQNSAARIITRSKKAESITPHLIKLHWLPVKQRIDFKILTLTYRCLHNLAPQYLQTLLKQHHPTRTLRSSSAISLDVPRSRTKHYGDRAFANAAPRLWNSLPQVLRNSTSLDTFKSSLKAHLFKEAF